MLYLKWNFRTNSLVAAKNVALSLRLWYFMFDRIPHAILLKGIKGYEGSRYTEQSVSMLAGSYCSFGGFGMRLCGRNDESYYDIR